MELCVNSDLITILEMEITCLGMVAEVNPLPVVSNDVLCPRVLVVTPLNQLVHPTARNRTKASGTCMPKQ